MSNYSRRNQDYYDTLITRITDSEYADVSTSAWVDELDFNNDSYITEDEEVTTLNALFW